MGRASAGGKEEVVELPSQVSVQQLVKEWGFRPERQVGAEKLMADGAKHLTIDASTIGKANFRFGWMHIHIHFAGGHIEPQKANGKPTTISKPR